MSEVNESNGVQSPAGGTEVQENKFDKYSYNEQGDVVYDDNSIDQLEGAERVRDRPEATLGSDNIAGARHTIIEIIGNALDEANSGYGNQLDIVYYEDKSVSVRDYGRGVPMGYNEKKKRFNWDLIYNEMYAGGKYGDSQKKLAEFDWSQKIDLKTFVRQFNYLLSVGLNGLGGACTQYTSEFFEVKSYRDGKCFSMSFKGGYPILPTVDENGNLLSKRDAYFSALKVEDSNEPRGTFVHWKPDIEVFSDVDFGADWLRTTVGDMLQITGLRLNFENRLTGEKEVVDAGGLTELVKQKFKGHILSSKDDDGNYKCIDVDTYTHGNTMHRNKNSIYVLFVQAKIVPVNKEYTPQCYHNSVPTSGGSQHNGIMNAIASFFVNAIPDMKLDYRDYAGKLGVVLSSFSNIVSYKGQTKDETDNSFIQDFCYKAVYDTLMLEYKKGNKLLIDAVAETRKDAETRIAIKEYEKQVRQVKKSAKQKPPTKFVSCKNYDRKNYAEVELWLTEGDSASTSCEGARDKLFQALLPVRGKLLNVLKAPMRKILDNNIIRNIFSVLGVVMDIGDDLFDINDLKVGKIIIATDADEDGYQIRVLLFLVFYKLAPKLIQEGKVYIAETPLYSAMLPTGKKVYIKTKRELQELEAEYGTLTTTRFKGLGESNAEQLSETTMSPQTRTLTPLTLDFNDECSKQIIDTLFGVDEINQRKAILTSMLGGNVAELMEENLNMLKEIEDSDIDEGVEYIEVE